MTDTKNPPAPETGCAPLSRPYAETVSLEVVWAAAYAAAYLNEGLPSSRAVGLSIARDAALIAQEIVDDLLAAYPRGGHV